MKKIIPFLLLVVLLGFAACENFNGASTDYSSNSNSSNSNSGSSNGSGSGAEESSVYITDTGNKYHKSSCSYLSKSKILISREEAKKNGYGPCSVCKP